MLHELKTPPVTNEPPLCPVCHLPLYPFLHRDGQPCEGEPKPMPVPRRSELKPKWDVIFTSNA